MRNTSKNIRVPSLEFEMHSDSIGVYWLCEHNFIIIVVGSGLAALWNHQTKLWISVIWVHINSVCWVSGTNIGETNLNGAWTFGHPYRFGSLKTNHIAGYQGFGRPLISPHNMIYNIQKLVRYAREREKKKKLFAKWNRIKWLTNYKRVTANSFLWQFQLIELINFERKLADSFCIHDEFISIFGRPPPRIVIEIVKIKETENIKFVWNHDYRVA